MPQSQQNEYDPPADEWQLLVSGHVAGTTAATDSLALLLMKPARQASLQMLGENDLDLDDVVSEVVLAILRYILKREKFDGNIFKFTVTVARNHCRNLFLSRRSRRQIPIDGVVDRMSTGDPSPLDRLLTEEQNELLQAALSELNSDCEDLLRAFYLDGIAIEDIRAQLGLDTVQGVYYRRSICLDKIYRLLNKRLVNCSYEQRPDLVRDLPSPEGEEFLD